MPFHLDLFPTVPASRLRKCLLPLLFAVLLAGVALMTAWRNAAPPVAFSTLAGRTLPLQSLRGKLVLVNFWATDCRACVAEMPELIDTYRRYRERGLAVVAVAMRDDPPLQVVRFARERALPFEVALDADGRVAQGFGDVQVTPTTFVIDAQGRIVERMTGRLDFAALAALLEQELKGTE
jgi:peroxiredoxin